jgi:acetoin utilization deacetylase AcuC-like enzyme
MPTAFVYHPRFLDHDTGPGHPERADRLRAIVDKLKQQHLWDRLQHLAFEPAAREWIERLHSHAYVERCFEACRRGAAYIDRPDSAISADSAAVAQLAVGGVLAAADQVAHGVVRNAFCAVRPPGHHAEAGESMGFCLFNNVALAAEYLIHQHGMQRVAIVDFDVHHGNGTQHLFERRSDVLFISLHQHPSYLFPGTGFGYERGEGPGQGYTLNVPFDPHAGDADYMQAMQQQVGPALEAFAPDALLVSAGFDAAAADPLAQMQVSAHGFDWMARFLKRQAETLCEGRLLAVLEGGYDLRALAEGVSLFVAALLVESGEDGVMAAKAGF